MLATLRSRLTYANVMATMAIFVALGGSSYAAIQIARNSVLSKHIKNAQVKGADLARSSVSSVKVKDRSLLAQDFAPGQLPNGSNGSNGSNGQDGRDGRDGQPGSPGPTASSSSSENPTDSSVDGNGLAVIETSITTTFDARIAANATLAFVQTDSNAGFLGVSTISCWLEIGSGGSFSTMSQVYFHSLIEGESRSLSLTGASLSVPGTNTVRAFCRLNSVGASAQPQYQLGDLTVTAAAA